MARRRAQQQKGLVLLIVLWTVAILFILAGTTGQASRLDNKLSMFMTQEVRCKWASRAGVEKVVALLNEDDRTLDGPADLWSYNPEDLNDVEMLGCHYTVRVVDEAGKLNVNTATRDQLLGLFEWGMDTALADAIIDWRDTDDEPGEEGVETGYYENLPYRYTIPNRPFRTVRELLKVRGVTEQLLYGDDTNFNGHLDDNEDDGPLTPPLDDGDGVLDLGWISFLTCYEPQTLPQDPNGTTKVDINQATAEQLVELGLTEAQAQAVIDSRPANGYSSIGALISTGTTTSTSTSTSTGTGTTTGTGTGPSTSTGTGSGQTTGEVVSTAGPPLDVATFQSIVDLITVSTASASGMGGAAGAGGVHLININTAPLEVFVALLGGTDEAYEVAQNIVSIREGTLEGFESLGDLLSVPSVSADLFAQIVGQLTTRSNVFTVYSMARADQTEISGASWHTEVVVDRSQSPPKSLYWYQGACP